MKTYTENSTNEDKESLSNESKTLNGANPKFVDNRPETIAQLKMQEMLKNRQQTMQMKNEQEMPNINTSATDELSKENIAPLTESGYKNRDDFTVYISLYLVHNLIAEIVF